MKTKNFKRKLNLACSTNDLRYIIQHIYFDEGYAVATDAHVLVKQSLREHNFTKEEIEIMNGKFIHKDAFIEILRYDFVMVTEEGFSCVCKKNIVKTLISFSDVEGKYPNYKDLFDNLKKLEDVDFIGMNGNLIKKINEISLSTMKTYKFSFFGKNKSIKINATDLAEADESILLASVMLNI